MTVWHSKDGRHSASQSALTVLDAIERKQCSIEGRQPKVLSIAIDEEQLSCDVELELVPCVVLLVRFSTEEVGYEEEEEEDEDEEEDDEDKDDCDYDAETRFADRVAYLVSFWVSFGVDMRLEELADRIETTRWRLKIMSERWSANGIPVELEDLRILRTSTWYFHQQTPVIARYRTLNQHLEMESFELEEDSLNDLLDQYGARGIPFERAQVKQTLAALGAHGWIDKLAINAIKLDYDLAEFLRSGLLYQSDHYGARPSLSTFDGHVRAHGWDEDTRAFSWRYDTVKIRNMVLPVTILLRLPGRSITEVIEHPLFTPDLIISDAWVEDEYGEQSLMIRFDQPRFLFCKEAGRVWEE
ncbi:hypothetical protein J3454_00015 [Erythrobacter sp. NFXS35]|uniref:hypothetical protein n=1 Tax=Erythrobacter sp. NFXS35 TaxID=2818436 RepID=UPI0032DFBD67